MSKTVKRVSRKVKRVMTVMMIGLVAMLGAKAEAHTRWFFGRPFVCSLCSDLGTLIDVFNDPINDPNSLVAAELTVKTKEVVIECADGTEVELKNKMTLIDESLITSWDAATSTATVEDFEISDGPLLDLAAELGSCGVGVQPTDVEIRRMQAQYNAYACTSITKNRCLGKTLISSMKLSNCTVQPHVDDNIPFPPTDEELYVCDPPEFNHVF